MAQIDKPNEYFNTKLYTGNGSTQSISGVNFTPDFTWIKGRSGTYGVSNHKVYDVVRGATETLFVNLTNAETTQTNTLTSFDSDGFSLGDDSNVNDGSTNYTSWNWYTGATASSNTDGSITSTVSANTTSGFSIVSWTGNATYPSTVGHGLGVAPKMIITKDRTGARSWYVYHESIGNNNELYLNGTSGASASSTWNSTSPTSSVFTVNTDDVNASGYDYIGYCFAEKKGFSKFGSYTGNGSTDGTFVYTGLSPSFVLLKETSNANNWMIFDNKRSPFNLRDDFISPDISDAETTGNANNRMDMLSNGFKIRGTGSATNRSGSTFIYMAFAENPLVGTNNTPAVAR